MRFVALLVVAVTGCGLGLAVPACDMQVMEFHYADAGAGSDAGACTCVQWGVGWEAPLWLSITQDDGLLGSGEGPPTCPNDSGAPLYEGHAGLVAPLDCGPCFCENPIGKCALSSTLTAHDVACQNLGLPHKDIPFDAPASWDGSCDNSNAIGAGAGVKSVTVAPIVVTESCKVGPPTPGRAVYPGAPYWHKYALGCHGRGWSECGDRERSICVPNGDAPSPDFKLCILQDGELADDACPDEWPDRHVLYDKKLIDHRACTECTCGAPVGSVCTAMVSVYENSDTTCSGPVVLGQGPLSSAGPGPCFDIPPPSRPLGSKSATVPTYIPGKCQAMGGDPFIDGDAGVPVETTKPRTFCCKR